MKILAVDIGTGTQDIFLFDSRFSPENGFKMVMPSATMMVRRKIKEATTNRKPILLTGEIMGGGPSSWAAEAHQKSGLPVYATPSAARSFNDDLDLVREMGISIVSEDEAEKLPSDICRIEMKDFDIRIISSALANFGVSIADVDVVAIAVFDHGNAPRGISDRKFRFDYLDSRIRQENRLSAFAYPSSQLPADLTRMQAVANSCRGIECPVVIMDTAPAAILGTLFDPKVSNRERNMIINIGNFHTLAFRMGAGKIEGVFEHHTGFLNCGKLDSILISLANGKLNNEMIFADHGHGALIYTDGDFPLDDPDFNIVVTGPRRNLLSRSKLKPYFAVPFGDMMLAGCFGLLAATADLLPQFSTEILSALNGQHSDVAPWDSDM